MRRVLAFLLFLAGGGLCGCSSDAPSAPIGLNRRPANPTVASPVASSASAAVQDTATPQP